MFKSVKTIAVPGIALGMMMMHSGAAAEPPMDHRNAGHETAQQSAPAYLAQAGIEVPRKDVRVRRGETVFGRSRPEVEPIGVRAGSFLIEPSFELEEEYSDNIFATEDDEESDFITKLQPRLRISSDWANHQLFLDSYGDIGFYADNSDEDYQDYGTRLGGRLDVLRSTNVTGSVGFDHDHEERSSPEDVNGTEPTEFDRYTADLQGFHRLNRLRFRVGGDYQRLDFDDVPTSRGIDINNDDRDRYRVSGFGQVGYEIQPSYIAFLRGSYNIVEYDDSVDDAGIKRDSDGYQVDAGIEIDFGGLLFGDFFVGYREQFYDDSRLDDEGGISGGADITWNVTPLTTLIASASSEIRESTTRAPNGQFASGRFFTTVGLEAQHELLRNLLLGANASYSRDDFQNISRTDDIYRAGASVIYLVHRNAHLRADYRFRTREADTGGEDFTENAVFVSLQLQY